MIQRYEYTTEYHNVRYYLATAILLHLLSQII